MTATTAPPNHPIAWSSYDRIHMPETKIKFYILAPFNFILEIMEKRNPIRKVNVPDSVFIEFVSESIMNKEVMNTNLLIYNSSACMGFACPLSIGILIPGQLLNKIKDISYTILITISSDISESIIRELKYPEPVS